MLPKSVLSVNDGEASPSTIDMVLPLISISGLSKEIIILPAAPFPPALSVVVLDFPPAPPPPKVEPAAPAASDVEPVPPDDPTPEAPPFPPLEPAVPVPVNPAKP